MSDLDKAITILLEDSKEPIQDRLRRAGISDLPALLERPDAAQALWGASIRAYLLPLIPSLLRALARRAEAGNLPAQAQVLALLGDKSPVKEAGLSMTSLSDQALTSYIAQLVKQLSTIK